MERLTIPDEKIEGGTRRMVIYWQLKKYEDTGLTPEQIQELWERDTAKKPYLEGDGYDSNGIMVYDTWICPNCDAQYEVEYDDYDFCPNCGQRLKGQAVRKLN